MGQSLTKVYVHITFSTKLHYPFIDDQIEESLFEYIVGICRELNCNPIQVGGHKDHVHILCQLSKHITQIKLLEELKKSSSKWIKTKGSKYSDFYWQDGYAIFSVDPNQMDGVLKYVKTQKEHHIHTSFKDELRAFFRENGMDYDERYVWD
jgi:putative transposase